MVSASQNRPPYSLNSVDNALRLLDYVREHQEVRLSDAASELGVANSTAHRLLATLAHHGYVVQDRSRVYRCGPTLTPLAQADASAHLRQVAGPYLQQLSDRTEETAHLVVLEGNGTRFIDCVEATQILRVSSRTGMLLPAHTNSGGKAMLARLTEVQVRALYPRGLPEAAKSSAASSIATLRRELMATRRRGYGLNLNESTRGISAAGRHVADHTGSVLGALVVAAPSARCDRRRLGELATVLIDVATAVEAQL